MKNSKTTQIIYNLCNKIDKTLSEEVIFDVFTPLNMKIESCDGCSFCFTNYKCKKNENNIDKLELALKNSDLIIIGSPVYLHNISSYTQMFLERFSYWCHTMPLSGKVGVVVSTSDSSGNSFVEAYLTKILNYFGVTVLGKISYMSSISNQTDLENQINTIAHNYKQFNMKTFNLKVSDFQEQVFQFYKNYYIQVEKIKPTSPKLAAWKYSNFAEFKSFQDLVNSKNNLLV